jgi:hypothetical protein
MASRTVAAARLKLATEMLLQCRSGSAVVAALAESEGISKRQARRIVGAAYDELKKDIEDSGLDRSQLVAQIAHGLLESMGKALASGHGAVVVGAARQLDELLGLGVNAKQPMRRTSYGRSGF